jgi:hypothetical protein
MKSFLKRKFAFLVLLTVFLIYHQGLSAQDTPEPDPELEGAWTTTMTNENGESLTVTAIVMDGFLAETFYNLEKKHFEGTVGGKISSKGDSASIHFEFSTVDAYKVGESLKFQYQIKEDELTTNSNELVWKRLDKGQNGALAGAWLFTGRERNGEMSRRTPGARKTMKILSDTRFQWIAYKTDTGEFFGTGGGTMTAENGVYKENIEFFSRDSSRVGASLSFKYSVEGNEWHHKGKSSKGDPMYEIWTLRTSLESE